MKLVTVAACILLGYLMSGQKLNKLKFTASYRCVYSVHVWVDAEPTCHVNRTG